MTQVFTKEHRAKLEQYLATHDLPKGLGTDESACSIAAINLAIAGKLTDNIPACMSFVLGKATITLQDAMPAEMRNSQRYKALLPNMAGTGRNHERQRLDILMDWMWAVVLPQMQSVADSNGFGPQWQNMCDLKTSSAADAASRAAYAAYTAADADAYAAARAAARAAADAADAAYAAARADARADASGAAYAAYDAAYAAARATADADASGAAACAAANAASADVTGYWETVDLIGVLERMTYLNEGVTA